MKKLPNLFVLFAIISYAMKLLVDGVMYVFILYGRGDIYYDDYYQFLPQVIATLLMMAFYCLFFTKPFYGAFIKITTGILILLNVVFMGILVYDRTKGYIFYFALVAAINFLNALYLKCNVIPLRKPGAPEFGPLFFEIITFAVMAISLYALFCSFPLEYNHILYQWEYYDVVGSIKLNIISDAVLLFIFIACRRNDSEYIRDNMFDEDMIPPELL